MTDNRPRKHFGQNFLHDRNILDKIIRVIQPQPDERFVEIGPGRGAMTGPLLEKVQSLDVIEIDHDLAAALPGRFAADNLTVHQADALKFDFRQLQRDDKALRLTGNLPYNISTPLLFHILEHHQLFSDIHVMLQKEVAMRIAAEPGNRTYGRLSVAIAARCRIEHLFNIKPGSFTPAPRVDSSFIRLVPDAEKRAAVTDFTAFDRVVKQSFAMRRKRLSNTLGKIMTSADIESVGIDPGTRAEQLSVADFVRLANLFADRTDA